MSTATPNNRQRGYLKVFRSMFDADDPLWTGKRPRTRWEARLDLLRMAHHGDEPAELAVRGRVVMLGYGEVLVSERTLAERWRWSRGKVRRFLALLVDVGTLTALDDSGMNKNRSTDGAVNGPQEGPACGHYKFTNYASYNNGDMANGPAGGPARETKMDHKRTGNRTNPRTEERNTHDPDSSEPSQPKASEPPSLSDVAPPGSAFTFPTDLLVGKGTGPWYVERELHESFTAAFPGVDVAGEYQRAAAWLRANPNRRKTRSGMARFLNGWLERTQNRAGAAGTAPSLLPPEPR